MDYEDLEIYPIQPPKQDKKIKHHPDYFDLNTGALTVHISKPKGGKGVCCVNQLLNPAFDLINKLDQVYIFSPTAKSGDESWRFVVEINGDRIYEEYTDKKLRNILDNQLRYPKDKRPNISIIFDDIGTFPNLNKNSLLFKIAGSYRHYGIKLLYYCVQQFKQIPPIVRASMDYALISRTTNEKEIMDMEFEMGSKYDKQFRKLLTQATTKPYSFLYLRLNDNPSTAFENFTKKIYTAKQPGFLEVDHGKISDKKEDSDDEEEIKK